MSGSFYTLNAKYNTLQAQLDKLTGGGGGGGVPTSSDLAVVLANGDDAGGLDITNLNNLDVVTINGNPVAGAQDIDQVLATGDIATGKQMLLNATAPNTEFTLYKPDEIQVSDGVNTTAFFTPTELQYNDGTFISATWEDIINTTNTPIIPTLSQVLTAGNNAGASNIDMNGNEIANVSVIDNTGNSITIGNGGADNIIVSATDSLTLVAFGSIGLTAKDTSFPSGKGISITSDTPNIWYNLNTANVNDRLVIDNNGLIECVSGIGSSPQGYSLQPNNFLLSNFDLAKSLEMNTDNGIRFTSSSGSVTNATYTPIQMTIDDTAGVGFKTTMDYLSLDIGSTASTTPRATLSGAGGTLTLNQSTTGYTSTPSVKLTNFLATAGATNGVPSVETYKSGRNAVAGDTISSQHFYAKNSAGTKTEFARMEASVRNTGVGNDDGSIAFSGLINGVQTEFFRVNGADSENNMFLPLDMNGQSIKSSGGNLAFSSTGSSGGGVITMTSKTQSPTSQPDFIIANNVTNTLTHSVSAGWDFQANNLTTSGNITCNTLNYTSLNPPISGTTTTYAGVTNISASLTTLTGTTPYGRIYTSTFSGTAQVRLPTLGTSPLKTITFTLCGVGASNDFQIQNSAGTILTTLVGGLDVVSYTFVDNTSAWIWL